MKISGKINLLMLKAAVKKMKATSGEIDCLVIPIDQNKLFRGEKGIYLDIIAFDLPPKEGSKDTHLVKQSFSKEAREKMSEEEIKSMPILGNLSMWLDSNSSEPISSSTPISEEDDLPF